MVEQFSLAMQSISYRIGELTILSGIHANLPTAQLTAVMGANGAGKSTLLQVAAGILKPTCGRIEVHPGSRSMDELSARERAKLIAWVPPLSALPFSMTCRELVILGRFAHHRGHPTSKDHDVVSWALSEMGIEKFQDRRLMTMSSGEQQKAAIARGLASGAPILLFDEPTANLDIAASVACLELLQKVALQNRCVVMAIHDLMLAFKYADHVIALRHGKEVFQGSPNQLDESRIEEIYDLRVEILHNQSGQAAIVLC